MNCCPAALLITLFASSLCSVAIADDHRVVYETEIDADIDAVWNAFTTNDGLQSWMAPLVEIELVVGGKMKANYNAKGRIGDDTTIENTILIHGGSAVAEDAFILCCREQAFVRQAQGSVEKATKKEQETDQLTPKYESNKWASDSSNRAGASS